MLEIVKASSTGDHCLDIVFNNGRSANINLKNNIFNDNRSVFLKLRNPENFKNFSLAHGTIIWSDELNLAPEYLFYIAFKDDKDLQYQFREWGYII